MDPISKYMDLWQQKTVLKMLLNSADVLHFIPGRVRLQSKQLVHNYENTQKLTEYLNNIKEIEHFSINATTGSLLIRYNANQIRQQPLLIELENMVAKKYKKGAS